MWTFKKFIKITLEYLKYIIAYFLGSFLKIEDPKKQKEVPHASYSVLAKNIGRRLLLVFSPSVCVCICIYFQVPLIDLQHNIQIKPSDFILVYL